MVSDTQPSTPSSDNTSSTPSSSRSRMANGSPSSRPRSLAVLDDPDIQQVIAEDPLFRFISNWWRQLLVLILGVGLAFYGQQRFQESRQARLSEAAELLSRVHRQYESLRSARNELKQLETEKEKESQRSSGKEGEEDKRKRDERLAKVQNEFNESRRLMSDYVAALSDAVSPYDSLAKFYAGLLSFAGSEAAKAAEELQPLGAVWGDQEPASQGRLIAELAALSAARMLIDDDATYAQGRSQLRQLAILGYYVRVSAAVAFARVSESSEEKEEAHALLLRVIDQFPDLADQLKPELAPLAMGHS